MIYRYIKTRGTATVFILSLQLVDFLITNVCQRLQIMGKMDKVIGKAIGKNPVKIIPCLLLLSQVHFHLLCFK